MRKFKFIRAYNGSTAIGDIVEVDVNSHFDYTVNQDETGKIRVNGTLAHPTLISIEEVSNNDNTTYECVNFGGLTIGSTSSPTYLLKNIKRIKNLNIYGVGLGKDYQTHLWPNIGNLKEFEGNIVIDGGGSGRVWLNNYYESVTPGLERCKGTLQISNIKEFVCGIITNSSVHQYANVIDIRNVDTTGVVRFGLLVRMTGPCDIIIGNLTNESVTDFITDDYAKPNRVLICTTTTPPKLKNCVITNNEPTDVYSITYDWVAKGNFEKILVPPNCGNVYKNDTYIAGGTVGNTGWSKHASIIEEYNEGDYEPKEEWLYRKKSDQ